MKTRSFPARLCALTLAVALAAPSAWPQVRLPALGESAGEEFSVSVERNLGEQIMREIRRDPDYLDDPPLLEYLQSVWQPLLKAARQRGEISTETERLLAWEAFLVRDRSVNAFALPGGFVGVHLGLIAVTSSSDELAAVLAHELTHITQRHIARGAVNAQRTTLLSLAGLILGVLAASKAGSPEATQAVVVGSQAAAVQGQLNYSRDMEREADRVGFGVLTEAGFAPSGMAGMFEKLEAANRMNDNGSFPYLRSHPLTIDRISEARARIAISGSAPPADVLMHTLMAARARVLMDSSSDGLRRQQQRLAGTAAGAAAPLAFNERLGALYGGALATSLLGDGAAAEAAVAKALELLRGQGSPAAAERVFKQLQAQLWLQRGEAARAAMLLDAPLFQPATRSTLLLRAQAAVLQWSSASAAGLPPGCTLPPAAGQGAPSLAGCGQAGTAWQDLRNSTEALQSWVSTHAQDPLAWGLLGQLEELQGQRLRSLRAQAEARAALGDITGAIDRLRAAQALVRSGAVNDFIEASVIDSRLRQLMAVHRQLAAELRGKFAPLAQGHPHAD